MKKYTFAYMGIVALGLLLFVGTMCALLMLTRDPAVPATRILIICGASFAVLLALSAVVMLRFAKIYAFDFRSARGDKEKSKKSLESIGAAPLKSLVMVVVFCLLFVTGLILAGEAVGIGAAIRLPAFLVLFSTGMLCAALIFVLSDRLGAIVLLNYGIVSYPRDLREPRQQRKNFIIPTFMSLMAFLFAFGLSFILRGSRAAEGGEAASGISTTAFSILAVLFFGAVIGLVAIWTKTTALIYRSVIAQLDQLSSAEKDLTRRIRIGSIDELGTISGLVNDFCDGLSASVGGIKGAQARLSVLGSDLRGSADDSAGAVSQISSSVASVREKVKSQGESVMESSSAVEEIAKNIESLERLITDQAASVSEASASIEEMVGNIGSVTSSIEKMAGQFGDLLTAAETSKSTQALSLERVEQISARSEALLEANKVISAISSRTNLLAMNAAIEAAHAGEAGRGFSVVADEIRHLAETAAAQSKTIKDELGKVQKAIQEVVASSRASEESFAGVAEKIGETDALVREIHRAMLEQKEGSAQVLEALRAMNDITVQVRTGSAEMSVGNKTVLEEIGRLRSATSEIKTSMEEMAVGADGITKSAKRVSGMAEDTMGTIRGMEEAIGCFKTA
jgi:methyl-accepting chemotaxis protein